MSIGLTRQGKTLKGVLFWNLSHDLTSAEYVDIQTSSPLKCQNSNLSHYFVRKTCKHTSTHITITMITII